MSNLYVSSVQLKMKDAMSDLATIMENETMEFDTGSTNVHHTDESSSVSCQEVCKVAKNDFHISNIHELSSYVFKPLFYVFLCVVGLFCL